MGKILVLVILLFGSLITLPFMLSSCGRPTEYETYYDDNDDSDIDISYKKKSKSARSLGGSRSYRSGK